MIVSRELQERLFEVAFVGLHQGRVEVPLRQGTRRPVGLRGRDGGSEHVAVDARGDPGVGEREPTRLEVGDADDDARCSPRREHLVDRPGGDELAASHDRDAIRDLLDLRQDVARDEYRAALCPEAPQEASHLDDPGGIEAVGRLVVVVLVGALLATAVGLVIAAFDSTPPTDAQIAAARVQAREEFANCLVADYEGVQFEGTLEEFCREFFGDPSDYMPSHLKLADLPEVLEGISSITSILALVVGASVVAVSWQTGTISTIFTWEPRRLRWFAARILVIAAGVFVMTLVIVAFVSAGLALAAMLRGSTVGIDGGWRSDVLTTSLRVSVAAAAAALIGGGVAAAGRHTSAALGVVFVWTAVIEGLIRGFRPLWSPWLLGDNLVSFLSWRVTDYQVSTFESYIVTPGRASFVILGYVALTLALGFTFIRIRDVQ